MTHRSIAFAGLCIALIISIAFGCGGEGSSAAPTGGAGIPGLRGPASPKKSASATSAKSSTKNKGLAK